MYHRIIHIIYGPKGGTLYCIIVLLLNLLPHFFCNSGNDAAFEAANIALHASSHL